MRRTRLGIWSGNCTATATRSARKRRRCFSSTARKNSEFVEQAMTHIEQEHIDYRKDRRMLRMYRDLYTGGQHFKNRADEYLLRRQKEPLDVYAERLQRAFYQNYIGSIIEWYGATLFRRSPSLQMDEGLQSSRDFLARFADDCDLRGTDIGAFFRGVFVDALVSGRSHILLDFPRVADRPSNRAEEDAAGISRAYLVRYRSEELINWCMDERGQYEWVVLRQAAERQPDVGSSSVMQDTYWFYFDKKEFRTYRSLQHKGSDTEPVL